MPRKLVLKRESLTALTTAELAGVAGANAITPYCPSWDRCPTDHCVSVDYMCIVSQAMDPCVTAGC